MKLPFNRYIVTDGTMAIMPEKGKGNYSLHRKASQYVEDNAYKTHLGAEKFKVKVEFHHKQLPELQVENITVWL